MLIQADALRIPLKAESVQCVITSPPYWGLRQYNVEGQLGIEAIHDCLGWASGESCGECYVCQMREAFREVLRALRKDGTAWVNLGDVYAGSWGTQGRGDDYPGSLDGGSMLHARQIYAHPKPQNGCGSMKRTPGLKSKDLCGLPWRVALALQADGWWLRRDIIWEKRNPLPESVTDRPTTSHEYLFLFSKCRRYFYNAAAVREEAFTGNHFRTKQDSTGYQGIPPGASPHQGLYKTMGKEAGRNLRSVWRLSTGQFSGGHFAVMPETLVEPCILAGSREGDLILDPFCGSGTVGRVAYRHCRRFVGLDIKREYIEMAWRRTDNVQMRLLR